MSPERCLKLEKWQGPPHIEEVKQNETVLSLRSVCLFSHENQKQSLFI